MIKQDKENGMSRRDNELLEVYFILEWTEKIPFCGNKNQKPKNNETRQQFVQYVQYKVETASGFVCNTKRDFMCVCVCVCVCIHTGWRTKCHIIDRTHNTFLLLQKHLTSGT